MLAVSWRSSDNGRARGMGNWLLLQVLQSYYSVTATEGCLKVNTDAAFFRGDNEEGCDGVGAILCNSTRTVVAATVAAAMQLRSMRSADHARRCLVCLLVLNW